jgi:hypothetical protein
MNIFAKSTVLLAAMCGAMGAQAQTTVTAWSFDNLAVATNNAPAPSLGAGTAAPLGMTNNYSYSNAVTGSVATADVLALAAGGNEWRVRGTNPGNGWNLAAPQYTQGAQFAVSTLGFTGISFKYDWFSTNQGVRNLQAQYTSDGSTWNNVGALQVAVPNAYQNSLSINFGALGITSVNNNANFAVRLVSAYDPTFVGTPTYTSATPGASGPVAYNNSSGNWRFDNVSVQAVAAVPEPGAVMLLLAGLPFVISFARTRKTA